MNGFHAGMPLKSVSSAHTTPGGALISTRVSMRRSVIA